MAVGQPIIYRVGSKGAHIVGAMHLLREGDRLPQAYWDLQSVADRVIFESSLEAAEGIDWGRLGALDARKTLSEILPRALYQAASAAWSQYNLQGRIGRLKPWIVALTLQHHVALRLGLVTAHGVDRQLWDATPEDRGGWMETSEQGLAPTLNAPRKEIEHIISMNAVTPDVSARRLEDLHRAWLAQNEEGFMVVYRQMFEETPVYAEATVDARNRLWMPEILSNLDRHSSPLFVVGVLHLVGANNLIELLNEAGVETCRVS